MWAHATRRRRGVARTVLAAAIAVVMAGCAKEPPEEEEYISLKDAWANGTTVTRAEPPVPVKTVYTPPPPSPPPVERAPVVRPAPPRPVEAPLPPRQQTTPARPMPPTLAISPPKVETPPPAAQPVTPAPQQPRQPPPKALSESDLANGNFRCGRLDCVAVLRAMIEDPKQSWMMRAPSLTDFANGTRLFAYRALRTTLECGKLRFANAELDWAIDTFSNRLDEIDAAHRARVAALAEEVRAEIEGEIKKRC